jgi:saccharopine dehydrogenase (NAD+, L-lysine-forming)
MKAMVLGSGAVGSVTADILAKSDEYEKVVLADVNLERARRAEKKISSDKLSVAKVDASDLDALAKSMAGMDIALNAVIPRFNMTIMQACLRAGVNYGDMAWDLAIDRTKAGEVIKEVPAGAYLGLDGPFKKAGLTGIMGL